MSSFLQAIARQSRRALTVEKDEDFSFFDASEHSTDEEQEEVSVSSPAESSRATNKVALPPSFRHVLPSLARDDYEEEEVRQQVATRRSTTSTTRQRCLSAAQSFPSTSSLSSLSSTASASLATHTSSRVRVTQRGGEWWVEPL